MVDTSHLHIKEYNPALFVAANNNFPAVSPKIKEKSLSLPVKAAKITVYTVNILAKMGLVATVIPFSAALGFVACGGMSLALSGGNLPLTLLAGTVGCVAGGLLVGVRFLPTAFDWVDLCTFKVVKKISGLDLK